jgi:hypothetical protein
MENARPFTWDQLNALMDELRKMARALLAMEGNAQSLQSTELVDSAVRRMAPAGPDLRLMSWGDGSGVPTSGKNLVIVGLDYSGLLHIRLFDSSGKYTDTDETTPGLPAAAAGAITTLKQQVPGLLPPQVLTPDEKAQVMSEVRSIVGHTPPASLDWSRATWADRHYFLGAVRKAMRAALVDHARRRLAQKRPPPNRRVQIEEIHLENLSRTAEEQPEQIEALHIALGRLREQNPDWAELIEHYYFSDYTWEKAARFMGISERTARRDGDKARLLLHREILKILNEEDIAPEGSHGVADE